MKCVDCPLNTSNKHEEYLILNTGHEYGAVIDTIIIIRTGHKVLFFLF
jgi:hypothetical protein